MANDAAVTSAAPHRGVFRRAVEALREILSAERERWALWLPATFGAGIGLYFTAPSEPPYWLGPAIAAAALALALIGRRHALVVLPAIAIAAAGLGAAGAQWRAHRVAAP